MMWDIDNPMWYDDDGDEIEAATEEESDS